LCFSTSSPQSGILPSIAFDRAADTVKAAGTTFNCEGVYLL